MKLSKIYSNNPKFKPMTFIDGLNVIYGDVESQKDEQTGKVHEHNIGKTSLVYLIDFLLLKKSNVKDMFGKYRGVFLDWEFFLELKLNDDKYLTIKRAIKSPNRVSFKEHFSEYQDYSEETSWDYEELSLTAKSDEENPIEILNKKYLNFDVCSTDNYRVFLAYLLRTQFDYKHVFELDKFFKHRDWKPEIFCLLGYKSQLLAHKYDLEDELTENKNFIKKLQSEKESDEVYKIKAAIEAKENERKELHDLVDDFDFYQEEQDINYELVNNIEVRIALLNKEEYGLTYEVSQIRKALDSSDGKTIEAEDIKQLFDEVGHLFPKELIKKYEDVLDFSAQITEERRKYLKEELSEITIKVNKIQQELMALNKERVKSLSLLKERDTFVKYKAYQEERLKIDAEILFFKNQLSDAKTTDKYQEISIKLDEKIKVQSQNIKTELNKENLECSEIKKIFQSIYKTVMGFTALLLVEPNKKGNVSFDTAVLNSSQNLSGKGDGYTSMKVLCASFVLAVLIHYSEKSFFRFAYHDGILEGWGGNPKINFITLIRDYLKTHKIQYIISVIKSDVPVGFKFEPEEIRRELKKDDTLFGFDF